MNYVLSKKVSYKNDLLTNISEKSYDEFVSKNYLNKNYETAHFQKFQRIYPH